MVNYREILRLNSMGYSQRQIASSTRSSHHTVKTVLELASVQDISWPLDEAGSNNDLEKLFFPERRHTSKDRVEPDFAYIHKELARSGVTLTLLWSEYCEKCYASGQTPYMSTQFCDKYRRWARLTKATMRIQHKPGAAMQVDWAGNTIPFYDSVTGAESSAYLFVAVLPCSCYAYAEACADMKIENWLLCHVHAYNYFGGATRLLISDNLKAGVTSNTRYETVLNRSYQELAQHYGTAIVPTRIRHPQDKSLAEGTVKYASTWIIAALRDQKFFTLEDVRQAVSEKLEKLNDRPFQKREGNRRSAYSAEEQGFMLPLPSTGYDPAVWTPATVGSDYLISDGKNKYSVPFDLIGEEVQIRLTKTTVEVFFQGNRVASHRRKATMQREPVVKPEHMTPEHRKYLSYNADDFTVWATSIGSKTAAVVRCFLTSGSVPEQGYKACASLTKLAERYGKKRLECACEQVMAYSTAPSVRNINTLLKNGQNKTSTPKDEQKLESLNHYGLTRGASYFRKGGDSK